jgi:DNA mismatch repair protein MSH6
VLQRANEKSSDFEANYGKCRSLTKDKPVTAHCEDNFSVIKDLFHIVKTWPPHECQAASLNMIREVHKRAKVQAVEG